MQCMKCMPSNPVEEEPLLNGRMLLFYRCCCTAACRVRQWTGDTRKWYMFNSQPIFSQAGPAYVLIYGGLTAAFIFLMLLRGATFHLWTLGSSQRMHKKMVHK